MIFIQSLPLTTNTINFILIEMKVKDQITQNIDVLMKRVQDKEKAHNSLSQIDMLSGEGSMLRKEISFTRGQISALTWVLSNHIIGDL